MSSDNIITCPKCNKKNSLFEYVLKYPHITDGVFTINYKAECKNKKCRFSYWYDFSEKVIE